MSAVWIPYELRKSWSLFLCNSHGIYDAIYSYHAITRFIFDRDNTIRTLKKNDTMSKDFFVTLGARRWWVDNADNMLNF